MWETGTQRCKEQLFRVTVKCLVEFFHQREFSFLEKKSKKNWVKNEREGEMIECRGKFLIGFERNNLEIWMNSTLQFHFLTSPLAQVSRFPTLRKPIDRRSEWWWRAFSRAFSYSSKRSIIFYIRESVSLLESYPFRQWKWSRFSHESRRFAIFLFPFFPC